MDCFSDSRSWGKEGYYDVSAAYKKEEGKRAESEEPITPPKEEKLDTVDVEICTLARHFGSLQSGQTIEITLQELLAVIPHTRRRSDSYDRLRKRLADEYGVSLKIISRKMEKA